MRETSPERISYFSLTEGGALLALRLCDRFGGTAHLPRCQSLGCGHCSPFDSIAEALPQRFLSGDTIVCVMAAGIVIRLLAPYLKDKHTEPAVVVIDEEGRHAIPLLGGHAAGANRLAAAIAAYLGGEAAITTSSDAQGLVSVDEVARLVDARIDDAGLARTLTAALVNGAALCIESAADPGIPGYTWVEPGGDSSGFDGRLQIDYRRQPQISRDADAGDAAGSAWRRCCRERGRRRGRSGPDATPGSAGRLRRRRVPQRRRTGSDHGRARPCLRRGAGRPGRRRPYSLP